MFSKPSAGLVAACAVAAAAAMIGAVYAAGSGHTPIAVAGAAVFVLLGGVTFELARRRAS